MSPSKQRYTEYSSNNRVCISIMWCLCLMLLVLILSSCAVTQKNETGEKIKREAIGKDESGIAISGFRLRGVMLRTKTLSVSNRGDFFVQMREDSGLNTESAHICLSATDLFSAKKYNIPKPLPLIRDSRKENTFVIKLKDFGDWSHAKPPTEMAVLAKVVNGRYSSIRHCDTYTTKEYVVAPVIIGHNEASFLYINLITKSDAMQAVAYYGSNSGGDQFSCRKVPNISNATAFNAICILHLKNIDVFPSQISITPYNNGRPDVPISINF